MSVGRVLAERFANLRRFWREPPVLAVIAFNLIPVASVIWFGWSAGLLIIFYWIENVLIGAFNAPKIALAAASKGRVGEAAFYTPFFILHYGLFTLVHGVFVFLIFGAGLFGGQPDKAEIWSHLASPAFRWNVAALVLFYLLDFLIEWIGKKRYRDVEPGEQMMAPYARIVILHLTILGGAFLLSMLGDPIVGVVLIALFKTVFDVIAKASRYGKREAKASDAATRKPAAI